MTLGTTRINGLDGVTVWRHTVLVCQVITSKMVIGFGAEALTRLEHDMEARNRILDISGVLHSDGSLFTLVLEGDDAVLSALTRRIMADKRHLAPRIVGVYPIPLRRFGKWGMRFIRGSALAGSIGDLETRLAPADVAPSVVSRLSVMV